MRVTGLLLAILLTVGCGVGSGTHNMGPRFSSTAQVPPTITTLFPSRTAVGSAPFVLTINGTNFTTSSVVFWNGVPHTAVFVSSNQLMVTLTAADLTTFGLVPVYVFSAGMNSNTINFDMTAQ